MVVVLTLIGFLEFSGGISVFAGAKSAIHEILGILMIGFGFLTIGLASILHELRTARQHFTKSTAQS